MRESRNGLKYAIESGAVIHHKADVERMVIVEDGVALTLTTGAEIHVDRVLLATGFSKKPPGAGLVERMVRKSGLETVLVRLPGAGQIFKVGRRAARIVASRARSRSSSSGRRRGTSPGRGWRQKESSRGRVEGGVCKLSGRCYP